ncbi:hypothetical protein ES703_90684 [subsurface metagenome]
MPLPIPLILAAIKLIPKLRKSKTAGANVGVGAVMTILAHFGVDLPPEVITACFVVLNLLMRVITNKSLSDK